MLRHPGVRRWWTFIYPRRNRRLIFVCREHRHVLPDTHPITDEERAELERRREEERRVPAGRTPATSAEA